MKKFIFFIPLMAVSLLVSCNNGGGGDSPKPPVTRYSISMVTTDTDISPKFMDAGEPYLGTITVTNDNKILDGKNSLASVKLKVSGDDITSYCTDYNPKDDYATFTIPAQYITDDIEVEVTLKDKPAGTGTVIWYDENGVDPLEVDTDVTVGNDPSYDRKTPYKAKDATNIYRFSGWDPELHPVTEGYNKYKAVYTPVSLTYLKAEMKIVIPETSNDLTFGFIENGTKEITVDWGDEVVDSNTSHTYDESGTYGISICGEDITSIDAGSDGRAYLTEIKLQEGITAINDFYNCANLTSISVPSSIASVKNEAFTNCNNLVYETYDGCKYLGNNSNKYQVVMGPCENTITSASIHEGCTVIKDAAFNNRSQLASVVIPDGVISIPEYAFRITALTSIIIPNSVTSIGEYAFSTCEQLMSVNFDTSPQLKNIGQYAFNYCTALKSVVIPPSVEIINQSAFGNVTSLQEVDLSGFDVTYSYELPILTEGAFTKYPDSVVFYVKSDFMRALFATDDVHGWGKIDDSLYVVKL